MPFFILAKGKKKKTSVYCFFYSISFQPIPFWLRQRMSTILNIKPTLLQFFWDGLIILLNHHEKKENIEKTLRQKKQKYKLTCNSLTLIFGAARYFFIIKLYSRKTYFLEFTKIYLKWNRMNRYFIPLRYMEELWEMSL